MPGNIDLISKSKKAALVSEIRKMFVHRLKLQFTLIASLFYLKFKFICLSILCFTKYVYKLDYYLRHNDCLVYNLKMLKQLSFFLIFIEDFFSINY